MIKLVTAMQEEWVQIPHAIASFLSKTKMKESKNIATSRSGGQQIHGDPFWCLPINKVVILKYDLQRKVRLEIYKNSK